MGNGFKKLKTAYELAKSAKVGTEISCPSCGSKFIKTNYQSAFCKTKGGTVCKDKYWNTVIPTKRRNTTRISSANARFYENEILPREAKKRGFPDVETMRNYIDEDDGSWDAHSCTVEPCDRCGLIYEYCRCEDF